MATAARKPEAALICCLKLIYVQYGDSGYCPFYRPIYQAGRLQDLETLYEYLKRFGYEMSDEEIKLMNGTHPVYEYDNENLELTTNIFLPQSSEETKIEKSEIIQNQVNDIFTYNCIIKGIYHCKENPSHFGEGKFSLNFEIPNVTEKINFGDKPEISEPEKAPGFYMIKFTGNRL